jgi:hypothetical protein
MQNSARGRWVAVVAGTFIVGVSIFSFVVNYSQGLGFELFWAVPWTLVVAVFLVAASRALILRQAITGRLRRNQALGIGLTAAALGWFSSIFIQPPILGSGASPGASLGGDVFFFSFFLLPWPIFFYWVDSSTLNTKRSDPLLRDILHWSTVRKWVWGIIIAMLFIFVLVDFVAVGLFGDLSSNFIVNVLSVISIFTLVGIPFVTGLILLPIATRRSRDPTMRLHFKWFAYFVGFLGLGAVALGLEIISGIMLPAWQILWAVSGFFLYRSASSLVVVSQLPPNTNPGPITQTIGAS